MNSLKHISMNKMDLSKSEQHAIISVLMAIMEADGVIHPNETSYLNNVLSMFSTSESEMEDIPSFDPVTTPNILRSMNKNNRDKARELFVGMAKCDGYADPRELEIISAVV